MMFLLVLCLTVSAVGLGLMGEMYRRDQPLLGVAGLGTLLVASLLGAVYGTLGSS
jgi:hypothetical protein